MDQAVESGTHENGHNDMHARIQVTPAAKLRAEQRPHRTISPDDHDDDMIYEIYLHTKVENEEGTHRPGTKHTAVWLPKLEHGVCCAISARRSQIKRRRDIETSLIVVEICLARYRLLSVYKLIMHIVAQFGIPLVKVGGGHETANTVQG